MTKYEPPRRVPAAALDRTEQWRPACAGTRLAGVRFWLMLAALGLAALVPLAGQGDAPRQQGLQVKVAAADYPENDNVDLVLASTGRMRGATGQARVRRRRGYTQINIDLKDMQPAILYGGDFNTFCLWIVSPEGEVWNAGEIILHGSDGDLEATTPLTSFGLMVTAEPYFLVDRPSTLVVFLSTATGLASHDVANTELQYSDFVTRYHYEVASLEGPSDVGGESRTDRYQAVIAVRFAEEAGAQEWATEEFAKARAALSDTLQAFAQGMKPEDLTLIAHQAIRSAVYARRLAIERREASTLADERRTARETITGLQADKAQLQTRVAGLEQQNSSLEERLGKTSTQLDEVQQAVLKANADIDRLAREKAASEKLAESAQNQAAGFYARIYNALEQLADLRKTERGLTVNLPDVLFASGSSRLQPRAKELLSRIAGVLLIAPEYHLGIEGHTDSTGRTQFNVELSQNRAVAVRDYLIECGISAATMSTQGFGESQPIASNNTAAGRKQNRRVEIVIEGLTER